MSDRDVLEHAVGRATTLVTMLPLFLHASDKVYKNVDDIVGMNEGRLLESKTGVTPSDVRQFIDEGKLDDAAVEMAISGYYGLTSDQRKDLIIALKEIT